MKTPFKHQQEFINKNPDKALLVWEMQTGKTFAGILWLNKRKHLKALVVCPKSIVGKWKRDLKDEGAVADICTRDEIKKIDLNKYQAIILDEAQDYASPIFDKSRSQRTTALYTYVKNNPNAHILCLSATPIRSTPWNIHTLACFLGVYWDKNKFRDEFFHMSSKFGIYHYEKNKDWRIKIRPYLESISNIVLAKDVVERPKQVHEVIKIPWTKKQEESLKEKIEPASEFNERRRAEQGEEKWKVLKEKIDGYRKVILVVYFRDQIEDYKQRIGEDREVFVLHGGVKDQDKVIEDAKASNDCVFIIQAGMGAGFSASEFSVMIFASMSYKYVDYIQATGRMDSLENLHVNNYIYLLAGKTDISVYETILSGNDFNPHKYMLEYKDDKRSSPGLTSSPAKEGSKNYTSSREVVPF